MKKTLVISAYAPPSGSGSGLMMYFLLKYLPQSGLAILTSENNTDPKLAEYKLKIPYYFYGSEALAVRFNDAKETKLQKLKRLIKKFAVTKFFAQLVLLTVVPFKIVKQGKKAIQQENIQVILGYSDWGLVLLSVYVLHRITKKPFVLHFYDMYVGNKMPWLFKVVAKWLEPKLFQHASRISVMCEELQEHYEKKYNREISVIHNSIDFSETKPIVPDLNKQEFKITFLGNIYWAQEQAVRNVVQAVEQLKDLPIKFYLYTPHSKEYLESIGIRSSEKIIFTFCQPQEVSKVMTESNLLLVALSFGTKFPNLINTSSPGKLCEYLISGRPILVHAPAESFLSKYAKKHNFALVADNSNLENLKQEIVNAYKNQQTLKVLTDNAFKVALQNHMAKTVAKKLESMINFKI